MKKLFILLFMVLTSSIFAQSKIVYLTPGETVWFNNQHEWAEITIKALTTNDTAYAYYPLIVGTDTTYSPISVFDLAAGATAETMVADGSKTKTYQIYGAYPSTIVIEYGTSLADSIYVVITGKPN